MGAKLGAKLKARRLQKKWGLRRTARRAGCTHAHLYRVEKGDEEPSDRLLRALAGALELDADEVFFLARRVPEQLQRDILKHPDGIARARRAVRKRG